jgi:hypothetical protein
MPIAPDSQHRSNTSIVKDDTLFLLMVSIHSRILYDFRSAAPINSQLFDLSLIEAGANYLLVEGESGQASHQQAPQYLNDTKLETDLQADVTQFLNTSRFDSEFSGHIDIDEFLQL